MFKPAIIGGAPLDLGSLRIELCFHQWTATPEYDSLVDAAWSARCARERLWDGAYYRVLDPQTIGNRRAMRIGTIRYRYIATYPSLHEDHVRSGLEALNHLSTVALLRTRDGYSMFGRRAVKGAIELIGGGVQQDELAIASGADLERNLYKEMREEVGIGREHVEELNGLGAVLSSTSNVLLVARASLRITRSEAAVLFAHRMEDEMSDIIFVPENELPGFLRDLPDYRALISELL